MIVVDQRVAHAGRGQRRGKLRFPNTFGEPRSTGATTEVFFDVVGQPDDLLMAVFGRYHDQDGFVVSPADHFDLARFHHGAKPFEIFRVRVFQQFEQRAREVQTNTDGGVARQDVDEGQIGLLIGAFDHVIEISDWLVRMHEQNELKSRHSNPRRRIYRITRLLRSSHTANPVVRK